MAKTKAEKLPTIGDDTSHNHTALLRHLLYITDESRLARNAPDCTRCKVLLRLLRSTFPLVDGRPAPHNARPDPVREGERISVKDIEGVTQVVDLAEIDVALRRGGLWIESSPDSLTTLYRS